MEDPLSVVNRKLDALAQKIDELERTVDDDVHTSIKILGGADLEVLNGKISALRDSASDYMNDSSEEKKRLLSGQLREAKACIYSLLDHVLENNLWKQLC